MNMNAFFSSEHIYRFERLHLEQTSMHLQHTNDIIIFLQTENQQPD